MSLALDTLRDHPPCICLQLTLFCPIIQGPQKTALVLGPLVM